MTAHSKQHGDKHFGEGIFVLLVNGLYCARSSATQRTRLPCDESTYEELRGKHAGPRPGRGPILDPVECYSYQTSQQEVFGVIGSFPAGSLGGPDVVHSQHITELLNSRDVGPGLITELSALVNLFLAGTCPPSLRPLFFGGSLMAL